MAKIFYNILLMFVFWGLGRLSGISQTKTNENLIYCHFLFRPFPIEEEKRKSKQTKITYDVTEKIIGEKQKRAAFTFFPKAEIIHQPLNYSLRVTPELCSRLKFKIDLKIKIEIVCRKSFFLRVCLKQKKKRRVQNSLRISLMFQ